MSSVHRQNGKPNWFCAYYDPEGFRRLRTTGSTEKRVATTVCLAIDHASRLTRQGKFGNEKAMKLLRETARAIEENHGKVVADHAANALRPVVEEFVKLGGGELSTYSVKDWFNSWLAGATDLQPDTKREYRRSVDLFIVHLGARADRPLANITPAHVEQFKTRQIARKIAGSTINKSINALKSGFSSAVSKRQLEFSPAEHITLVELNSVERRPFTQDEIKALLAAAGTDWKTMIYLGYYTAFRLNDCAKLTRGNITADWCFRLKTKKGGKDQNLPIAKPLLHHLKTLPDGLPETPLCPALHGKKSSWLSSQFHKVMVKAGLADERAAAKKSTGKGRDGKRELSRISFHSLRHNTTSDLKSTGTNDSVTRDIVGHSSVEVNRSYTHIEDKSKRQALNKLPDIGKV